MKKKQDKTTLKIFKQHLGVLTFGNAFDILEIAKNTRPALHGGFCYVLNLKEELYA